ncbi:A/G-specific adenine glycosylase [Coraliomargarita sinensis]|uniref:Adenine DNA glycosylase n=1 Tax=Coraliomargarita sinensis TaxID=2174842 RepID=A0A317ZGX8_9BACT|nr:A/G-specific adenine glycosylase [Coraliomargarita sinensis]PXA03483.1 A/G-specific adenine glycosylase [Coraliomargarita sinensis]
MSLIQQQKEFQSSLAEWYAQAQRPLPWRKKPSVYRTVVSELMAQQTQIKTMLPYFDRWMHRFPDFKTLAAASEEDVLKHWEGLGYYSRARNLHKLAKAYVAASPKPRAREAWQALPGIGPYTSAAIASIAFHEPVAVVDGNVVRILARLTCDTRTFKSNGEAVKAFTALAEDVVAEENPGDHNQAMMELGATICLKRKPLCTICPVAGFCLGRTSAELDQIPKIQRKATKRITVERAWALEGNAILLHRIPESAGQLAGQYELPKLKDLHLPTPKTKPLAIKTRSITHRRIKEPIFVVSAPKALPDDHFWIRFNDLENITLSGPHRRWVGELTKVANKQST